MRAATRMDYAAQVTVFLLGQMPKLLAGFAVTLTVAVAAIPLALALGVLLLAPRLSGRLLLSGAVQAYIEVMRGTPLLLQIYLIYFGLPLIGLFPSEFTCGVIGIALQHGAFLCELYRAAIESVSQRQWEAGRAIGMTRLGVFRYAILPQALIKVLGPLGNQLIVLIKDTSLVSAIGVMELTLTGKMVIERSAASFEIFMAVALFYLIVTAAVGAGFRLAEQRYAGRL
jgi:His/Glu/Gln/Arg/opine family amino acid ABC transporter permease subunit